MTPAPARGTAKQSEERKREMYRLRTVDGITLKEIGARLDVGGELVRQVLYRDFGLNGRPPVVQERNRARSLARGEAKRQARQDQISARTGELIAAWRTGREPREIAKTLSLVTTGVKQVISEARTDADWEARARAVHGTRAASRDRRYAATRARAAELLAPWRTGCDPREIAESLGLDQPIVKEVIHETASDNDRASRYAVRRERHLQSTRAAAASSQTPPVVHQSREDHRVHRNGVGHVKLKAAKVGC